MGHIAGVFNLDGAPVSEIDRQSAISCLRKLPARTYEAPGLMMVDSDEVPHAPGRDYCCSWDGRLDNTGELITYLHEGTESSPARLACALFEHEGADGFAKLIGDWSLAMWDRRRRTLTLAADYAGVRPLYFLATAKRVIWASSLQHLTRWSDVTELDPAFVAQFLTRGLTIGSTPYRNVKPVPTGRAVTFQRDEVREHCFWEFPRTDTRLGSAAEYQEQLRSLFAESVAARTDVAHPILAELSGGLDSSSVVCFAHKALQARVARAQQMVTVTYVHDSSTDARYSSVVQKSCAAPGILVDADAHPFIAPDAVGETRPIFWQPRLDEVARIMGEVKARVMLTGQLGDFVMGNWQDDSVQAADLFRQARVYSAVQECFAWSRSNVSPVHHVLFDAVRSAIGGTPRTLPRADAADPDKQDSLTASLRSVATDTCRRRLAEDLRGMQPSRIKRYLAVGDLLAGRALECPEPLQSFTWAHPFAHRPLFEFMMTVPPAVVCGPGTPRRLMREAFQGVVPAPVLARKSKTAFGSVFRRALMPLVNELLNTSRNLSLVERGYVDLQSLHSRLVRYREGLECNSHQLRHVILLEFWLRTRGSWLN